MTPRQLLTRYSFQSLFRSEAMSESGVDAFRALLLDDNYFSCGILN